MFKQVKHPKDDNTDIKNKIQVRTLDNNWSKYSSVNSIGIQLGDSIETPRFYFFLEGSVPTLNVWIKDKLVQQLRWV